MPRHRITPAVAACAAVAMALLAAPAAQADSKNWQRTLSDTPIAPFNLAVSQQQIYVADGMLGTVSMLGSDTVLGTPPPGPPPSQDGPGFPDVAGVDVTPNGKTVAWTSSNADHSDTRLTISTRGLPDVVASLSAAEATDNPDQVNTYGIIAGGNACAEEIFSQLTGAATYTGITDSHPYSVVRAGNRWVVADAGANNLWSVSDKGAVSNLTVLPPQPVTFTPEMAAALADMFGMPSEATACLAGVTYAFEPVPTDVEVAPDGSLWVSVLPGGVESPVFGANGAVYQVNPSTGKATLATKGFLGATNLAVAPDGTVYVAELFGGQISKIGRKGAISTVSHVPGALSVEVHGGYLYVGTMAGEEGHGSIVRLKR